MRETGRLPPLWRLLIALLSTILSLILIEAGVRFLDPNLKLNALCRYHPALGWTQIPGATGQYQVDGQSIHYEFNDAGFRDVPHSLKKPPNTKRIVLIGDSFCEALQVNLEQTFFRRLENKLNLAQKYRWEVINLGVGDFGTAQEWVALKELGLRYSPDVVIVEIFPLNDICNNSLELYGLCKSKSDAYRPYYVDSEEGRPRLRYASPKRNFLRRHFLTFRLLEFFLSRFNLNYYADENNPSVRKKVVATAGFRLDPLLAVYLPDDDQIPAVSRGWKITEKLLENIVTECRHNHISVMAMVVPFEPSVSDADWQAFVRMIHQPALIRNYPETRLKYFFQRLHVPVVPLQQIFEKHADIVMPYRDGHLNPEGHRLAAETLYDHLQSGGIAP